jgi:hypothetical protein
LTFFAGLNARRLAGQKGAMPILQFFTGSRPVSRARFNPAADPPILSRHTYHSLQCTAQWDRHRKKKTFRRAGRDRFARHTPGMKYLLSDNNLEPADNKDSRVLYKLPGPTLDYPPCVFEMLVDFYRKTTLSHQNDKLKHIGHKAYALV